jgi:hypothetical protein
MRVIQDHTTLVIQVGETSVHRVTLCICQSKGVVKIIDVSVYKLARTENLRYEICGKLRKVVLESAVSDVDLTKC